MGSEEVKIPEGMRQAALDEGRHADNWADSVEFGLQAALLWLKRNPMPVSNRQKDKLFEVILANMQYWFKGPPNGFHSAAQALVGNILDWEERNQMGLFAPPAEIPEELRNSSIWCQCSDNLGDLCPHNRRSIQAFLLGREEGAKTHA